MFHYENWIVDGALAGIDPETPPNALLITVIPPKIESPFLKHTNKSTSSSVLKSPIPEMTKVSPEDIEESPVSPDQTGSDPVKKRRIRWKENLEEILSKRQLNGASGFVIQALDTSHLILAFFDWELNIEAYAIAHPKNIFDQNGRQFEIDDSTKSLLIYRQVSFDASPLEFPISFFGDGGSYGWVVKKVKVKESLENPAEVRFGWDDPFSNPNVPLGPFQKLIQVSLVHSIGCQEFYGVASHNISAVLEVTKALELPCLMRDPIPGFKPARNRIYASFISNLDLSINGLMIDKQKSRSGLKGNWVRVLVTEVHRSSKRAVVTLIDWGRSCLFLDFSDLTSIPSYIAEWGCVVQRFSLFACKNLTLQHFQDFLNPKEKLSKVLAEASAWLAQMAQRGNGFLGSAYKLDSTILFDGMSTFEDGRTWSLTQMSLDLMFTDVDEDFIYPSDFEAVCTDPTIHFQIGHNF